jgi:hypothetical protein
MRSWANRYIEQLRQGRAVTFRPRGKSMEGKIEDGQLISVHPLDKTIPAVGNIVLCTVGRNQYLHLITAISPGGRSFQISNNKGYVNGWIGISDIHGVYIPSSCKADDVIAWDWSAEQLAAVGDIENQPIAVVSERLLHARKRAFDAESRTEQLQAELDALKAAHAWIKTSERMPDSAEGSCCDVLAIIDGTAVVLNYTPDDAVHPWADEFSNIYRADEVTHWQPLPEPPK